MLLYFCLQTYDRGLNGRMEMGLRLLDTRSPSGAQAPTEGMEGLKHPRRAQLPTGGERAPTPTGKGEGGLLREQKFEEQINGKSQFRCTSHGSASLKDWVAYLVSPPTLPFRNGTRIDRKIFETSCGEGRVFCKAINSQRKVQGRSNSYLDELRFFSKKKYSLAEHFLIFELH